MGNNPSPKLMHVNWLDRIVRNPDEVSRFYTEVVGMTREPVQEDEKHTSYSLKDEAGTDILGICDEAVFPDWVQGWLPYIDIGDFDDSIAKVTVNGGEILKTMSMDYNWAGQRFCLVKDPSGAPVMLCEARPPATE